MKNQPKEEVFGTDIPRTSGGHSRGYPGPKVRSGRSTSWKNKHFGADIHDRKARTSTTVRRFPKSSVRRNFGLNFRSLEKLPKRHCVTEALPRTFGRMRLASRFHCIMPSKCSENSLALSVQSFGFVRALFGPSPLQVYQRSVSH